MLRYLAMIWSVLIIVSVVLITRRKIKDYKQESEDQPNSDTELN